MLRLHLVCAVLAFAAVPAAAEDIPSIRLAPGEAVTVRFDDGGRVGEPERGRAEWSRLDVHAARELTGMTPPDEPLAEGIPLRVSDGIVPDPIPAGEVRLRFLSIAGKHALLVVENGQGRALRYQASMTVDGKAIRTDVCIVLPRLPSYEHWPHPVERLELSGFEFVAWPPGRAPTCE